MGQSPEVISFKQFNQELRMLLQAKCLKSILNTVLLMRCQRLHTKQKIFSWFGNC